MTLKQILINALVTVGIGMAIECQADPLVRLPEELAITRSVVTQERDELELTPSVQIFPPSRRPERGAVRRDRVRTHR